VKVLAGDQYSENGAAAARPPWRIKGRDGGIAGREDLVQGGSNRVKIRSSLQSQALVAHRKKRRKRKHDEQPWPWTDKNVADQ